MSCPRQHPHRRPSFAPGGGGPSRRGTAAEGAGRNWRAVRRSDLGPRRRDRQRPRVDGSGVRAGAMHPLGLPDPDPETAELRDGLAAAAEPGRRPRFGADDLVATVRGCRMFAEATRGRGGGAAGRAAAARSHAVLPRGGGRRHRRGGAHGPHPLPLPGETGPYAPTGEGGGGSCQKSIPRQSGRPGRSAAGRRWWRRPRRLPRGAGRPAGDAAPGVWWSPCIPVWNVTAAAIAEVPGVPVRAPAAMAGAHDARALWPAASPRAGHPASNSGTMIGKASRPSPAVPALDFSLWRCPSWEPRPTSRRRPPPCVPGTTSTTWPRPTTSSATPTGRTTA